MSEMALTADHLIIIGRGRLIADTPVDKLIESSTRQDVLVRSPRATELRVLLVSRDAQVADEPDGAFAVTGITAPAIGDLAAAHGIAVHELTPRRATLEEAYVELTSDSVDFRARGEASP